MKTYSKYIFLASVVGMLALTSCGDDEPSGPVLEVPQTYISPSFASNVTAEAAVIGELATMTSAANEAESNAQTALVAPIVYPDNLWEVTLPDYRSQVQTWLIELVASANSPTPFQNPGMGGTPAAGEEGGLLGTRLLDEYGLELEQMVQKGSFGAALYNHALTVINGDLSSSAAIDKLVQIFGTDVNFDPASTTAAATYARRRSNQTTQTGAFYNIRTNLLQAKAAIESGDPTFETTRDRALEEFLLNWEQSNYATVIYYCNAAKVQLQAATDDAARGNAMHAYAEGVAFAHGFRGISQKQITDAQIDQILTNLLAPAGQTPNSFQFLNDATLLQNLDDTIDLIQGIYNFSDEEVNLFFVNDPS